MVAVPRPLTVREALMVVGDCRQYRRDDEADGHHQENHVDHCCFLTASRLPALWLLSHGLGPPLC
jgi:hypothetical protein